VASLIQTVTADAGDVSSITITDLNGDGSADVVTTNPVSNSVFAFAGDGRGGLGVKRETRTGQAPVALAVADLSQDARPDLVTADSTGNTVSVLLNINLFDRSGAFTPELEFAVGGKGSQQEWWPRAMATADVNRDGHLDVVVPNYDANTVSVLFGRGSGSFLPPLNISCGRQPTAAAVCDLHRAGF